MVRDGPRTREDLEEALRASEERFRLLADAALDAVVAMDLDGRITGWNRQAEATFGWKAEEVAGRELVEAIVSARHRERYVRELERLRGAGEGPVFGARVELGALHRDGWELPVELTVTPLRSRDERSFAVFLRDVTERERSRRELLRARDAAEALARTKSEFLANMSHEIRTPMNGVMGMTGLLLDTDLSPEQREYVETIRSSGDALLTIIDDVLDHARLDSGTLSMERVPFEISPCVAEAVDLLAPAASEKGLRLSFSCDDDVPAVVVGDPNRLRQILAHLLSNAIKFTEAGEVRVLVSAATGRDAGGRIHFAVRDTGIGIPPDRMDRVFHAFQQVDASMTRRFGGTGLGLAISERLAEKMGGRMWVESAPGAGSTFHFTVALSAPAPEPRALPPAGTLVGRRVLVVVGDETHRRTLLRQTSSWGLTPRAVPSAPEALARLDENERFDLAILEVGAGGGDGNDLVRELRGRAGLASLPVVLLASAASGSVDDTRKDAAQSRPVDDTRNDAAQSGPANDTRNGAAQSGSVNDTRNDAAQSGPVDDTRNDAAQSGPDAFTEILTKPARPDRLYEVLTRIVRGATASVAPRPTSDAIDAGLASRIPLRILLAEDNRINQKVALRMLQKMGYRADVAGNGLEVLAALERQPYDVVLMDVQMPEMDGLTATRRIRSDWEPDDQPRIIALTANAMRSDREACRDVGMDDFIAKPITPKALADALERTRSTPDGIDPVASRGVA